MMYTTIMRRWRQMMALDLPARRRRRRRRPRRRRSRPSREAKGDGKDTHVSKRRAGRERTHVEMRAGEGGSLVARLTPVRDYRDIVEQVIPTGHHDGGERLVQVASICTSRICSGHVRECPQRWGIGTAAGPILVAELLVVPYCPSAQHSPSTVLAGWTMSRRTPGKGHGAGTGEKESREADPE